MADSRELAARWKNVESRWLPIIQPAIQQKSRRCLYAGLASHISYNLLIGYSEFTRLSVDLPSGVLIDHVKWEEDVLESFGEVVGNVSVLLQEAKKNGVPLVNGLNLMVDQTFDVKEIEAGGIKRWLTRWTVLAILRIFPDYHPDGEKPYLGKGDQLRNNITQKLETHAVVIIGEYFDMDNQIFKPGEKKESLWVYQNSDGDKTKSFLRNGLNVVKNSVIQAAYAAEVYAANPLLKDSVIQFVKARRPKGERVNIAIPRSPEQNQNP